MLRPLLISSAVALAACATSDATPTVTYACDDGGTLRVRFEPDAARVTLADGTELRLPQQRVASGLWYATPQHELRGKGDDATWTVGRRAPAQCRVRR